MGWMHDTLDYFSKDPIHRRYHHNKLSFSLMYAFFENFILPMSHDEVVYGKKSIFNKMPGDRWQKFANLRLLLGFMYAHPGKKLMFMGTEFAQWNEWRHDFSLDWHLLSEKEHDNIRLFVKDLNKVYKTNSALYSNDFDPSGFLWTVVDDQENSVFSFLRIGDSEEILVIGNFTPVARYNYRIGLNEKSVWKEIFNTDLYGGANIKHEKEIHSENIQSHNKNHSVSVTIPPLGIIYLKKVKD